MKIAMRPLLFAFALMVVIAAPPVIWSANDPIIGVPDTTAETAPAAAKPAEKSAAPVPKPAANNGAKAEAEEEPVYELPKYTVSAQRILPPPESWRYAITGQFEILSNASDSETQRLYRAIGEYIDVLNNIAPGMKPRTSVPIKLIICGRFGSFGQITGVGGVPVVVGQNGEQISFAINVSNDFAIPLNSGSYDADDPTAYVQNRVFRNYIDLRLNSLSPRLPPWFEHAMRSLFTSMKFNGNNVTFAEIRDGVWEALSPGGSFVGPQTAGGSGGVKLYEDSLEALGAGGADVMMADTGAFENADAAIGMDIDMHGVPDTNFPGSPGNVIQVSPRVPIMRMADFFEYNSAEPGEKNLSKFNPASWARQCVMFTHYWLFRRTSTQKDKAAFVKFLTRASQSGASEALFKECFGFGYRTMEMELSNYQTHIDYNFTVFKFKEDTRPPKLEFRDATPAEIGRMKGETMVAFGKADEGYHEMLAPYIRKQGDPDLHATLGLFEYAHGGLKKARSFLEIAVKTRTSRPDAYRTLSQLRRDEILEGKPDDYRFTSAQLNAVIEPLLAARTLRPSNVQTYTLLAEAWCKSDTPATKEQAALVLEGVNRYPSNPGLTVLAANVMFSGNHTVPARVLVQRALRLPGIKDEWRDWLRQADDILAHTPLPPKTPDAAQN